MKSIPGIALLVALTFGLLVAAPVAVDSSSPRLAAYYDRFLALYGDSVFEWSDSVTPVKRIAGIKQVGVGQSNSYALTKKGELLAWDDDPAESIVLANKVSSFYAGRTALLVIRNDGELPQFDTRGLFRFGEKLASESNTIADNILTAAVGDSANYYVTRDGALFVLGRAHRGQCGDGKLTASASYVQTTADVAQVVAHTGHALILKRDGTVWGTGGNICGPLGRHGLGDKAIKWGLSVDDVQAIATGSTHSLATKRHQSLWIWGRNEGLEPKHVLGKVSAVATGSSSTLALSQGSLWQWSPGEQPRSIMKCADI
jgi:alpha-tubulin suppressor-like RCC1 family protein